MAGLSTNKLSIHLGEDKTKSILSSTKIKKEEIWIIKHRVWWHQYQAILKSNILRSELDKELSGEAMALKVINTINSRLRFLYRIKQVPISISKRLLWNKIIQPDFDYACSALHPKLKKIKSKLETIPGKCFRYFLLLDRKSHTGIKEFEQINWIPVSERFD